MSYNTVRNTVCQGDGRPRVAEALSIPPALRHAQGALSSVEGRRQHTRSSAEDGWKRLGQTRGRLAGSPDSRPLVEKRRLRSLASDRRAETALGSPSSRVVGVGGGAGGTRRGSAALSPLTLAARLVLERRLDRLRGVGAGMRNRGATSRHLKCPVLKEPRGFDQQCRAPQTSRRCGCQERQVRVAAKLRRAVEHARLAAHQQEPTDTTPPTPRRPDPRWESRLDQDNMRATSSPPPLASPPQALPAPSAG